MKSTLKKLFSLIISVIAVFVIIIGFAPNGSTRAFFGFKSGAVYPLKNTFYAGVFRLAEYLKTEYPDTPILWITPCPTAVRGGGGANGHDVNQPLSAYVHAIKDVCDYFEIPVCDMSNETSVPYYTPEDLKKYWRGGDGIHPNGKASEIYSFKIGEYMKKAYESYGYKWDNK